MKTLFLLRHAKSSWNDERLQDFDRQLNSRGRKAAESIAGFMNQKKVAPELVLSSPAIRARETIDIVYKAARLRSELRYDQRIYDAGPLRLLEVISEVEEDKNRVLLVGHNPGLEGLLEILAESAEHMATCSLARIDFKVTKWNKVLEAKGTLEWIVKPKELA